jgi:hypothetical protein
MAARSSRLVVLGVGALLLASALSLALSGLDDVQLFGLTLPPAASLALVALGLAAGLAALLLQNGTLLAAAALLLVLPALEARAWDLTPGRLLLAIAWALATLAFLEIAHMNARLRAIEAAMAQGGSPPARLEKAVGEYLKVLVFTLALTTAISAAVAGLYFGVRAFGPLQHRQAVEFAGVPGFALMVLGLVLAGVLAALARGSDFSWLGRRKKSEAAPPVPGSEEVDVDALE